MRRVFDVLFIAFCTGLIVFIGAAERPLTRSSEGRVARVAQEMLDDGDWVVPHLNGVIRREKPPFSSWMVALTTLAAGDSEVREWHAYVPTGAAAIALIVFIYLWLGSTSSPRTPVKNPGEPPAEESLPSLNPGMLAALVLVSAPQFFLLARSAQMDMLLALCVAAIFWGYWSYREHGRVRDLLTAYAATGISVLIKGHVGIAIAFPALLIWNLYERRRQALSLPHSGAWRWHLLGIAMVLAISLPWLIPFIQRSGITWALFNKEGLGGRIGSDAAHQEVWYWYFRELPGWFAPWTLLLIAGLWQTWNLPPDARSPLMRLCWIWVAWSLLLFTALTSKDQHYALPFFAPLAMLIAGTVSRWLQHFEPRRAQSARAVLLVFSILFVIGALAGPALASRASMLPASGSSAVWAVAAIAAAVFALGAWKLLRCRQCVYMWWAGFICLTVIYSQTLERHKDAHGSPRRFSVEVRNKVPPSEPLYDFDVALPMREGSKKPVWRAQVLFYLHRKVTVPEIELPEFLKQNVGAYAIATQKNLQDVPADAYEVLAQEPRFLGHKNDVFLIRAR